MTTLNLYQDEQELRKKLSSKGKFFGGGVLFPIGILIITSLTLFGLKIASFSMAKQNDAATAEIQSQNKELAGLSDLGQIIDMQTRLQHIKNSLKIENGKVMSVQLVNVLDNLGADVDKNIVISNFEYLGDGKIKLTFNANNFSDVSRQILNFKSSEKFKDLNLTSIYRGDRVISCDIEMFIK